MLKEFKQFAVKGNALDMAVGIIIGAAFGTIVRSLVDDMIMPPVGLAVGGVDFADLFFTLAAGTPAGPYATLEAARTAGAVTVNYGVFFNAVISFLIVTFVLFLIVRSYNRLERKKEAAGEGEAEPADAPEPPEDIKLLREIRDLLRAEA